MKKTTTDPVVNMLVEAKDAIITRAQHNAFEEVHLPIRQLADVVDDVVRKLVGRQFERGSIDFSIIALGGYGRRELFPFSDIDLVIVVDQQSKEQIEELVKAVIYPLWDAGLAVGHAVRDSAELLAFAGEDLTGWTAMLDSRLIVGSRERFGDLERQFSAAYLSPEAVSHFVELIIQQQAERHKRFGGTLYMLEPNVKNGVGGLRDISCALWAAKARFGVADLTDLATVGAATARQQESLESARRFLWRLRMAIHTEALRGQDRLTFESQEQLAPQFFPGDRLGRDMDLPRPDLESSVERLMQSYYRSARAIVLEAEGVLQRSAGRAQGAASKKHLQDSYYCYDGRLATTKPEIFWDTPAEMLRAFMVAAEHGLFLDRSLQDAIAEAAAREPGMQLRVDAESLQLWLHLLEIDESSAERSLLERMHDLGVLNAVIPEFEACTGRVQHDLFHVYTVDRHSIYVVSFLKSISRGDYHSTFPVASAVFRKLRNVRTLYLAALLHDIGKPYGKDHSQKGSRLSRGIVARLGLSNEEQRDVVFLVENHLLMPRVSQRRDLSDASVIDGFCVTVGTLERLRKLYLLSLADTEMTAPGNATEWKLSLLNELYSRSWRQLSFGSVASARQSSTTERRHRERLKRLLSRRFGRDGRRLCSRLPKSLVAALPPDSLAHHASVVLKFESAQNPVSRVGCKEHDAQTLVLTVCCDNAAGVLATITGLLFLQSVNVFHTQVHTIEPADPNDDRRTALDIFWISMPCDPSKTWCRQFGVLLRDALIGEIDLSQRIDERVHSSITLPRVIPRVPTEIFVDNEESEDYTIIEVQSADRPGRLWMITNIISSLSYDIVLSKTATEVGRSIDIFYVQDGSRQKVRQDERIASLKAILIEELEKLPLRYSLTTVNEGTLHADARDPHASETA